MLLQSRACVKDSDRKQNKICFKKWRFLSHLTKMTDFEKARTTVRGSGHCCPDHHCCHDYNIYFRDGHSGG